MMKKCRVVGWLVLCVCLSFFLGCRYGQGNEREDWETVREARYQALLSFSVDKLEELKDAYDPSAAAMSFPARCTRCGTPWFLTGKISPEKKMP